MCSGSEAAHVEGAQTFVSLTSRLESYEEERRELSLFSAITVQCAASGVSSFSVWYFARVGCLATSSVFRVHSLVFRA